MQALEYGIQRPLENSKDEGEDKCIDRSTYHGRQEEHGSEDLATWYIVTDDYCQEKGNRYDNDELHYRILKGVDYTGPENRIGKSPLYIVQAGKIGNESIIVIKDISEEPEEGIDGCDDKKEDSRAEHQGC